MKNITAFAVGLVLVGALSAAPAQAQNQHSFVSSLGNDANACTLAAPCRHLQAALTATISGGEIAILDTAGYNGGATVTITKAVSIVNPGGFEAAIAPPSGGTGILINAGTNDAVSLRGLSIDGAGVGATGIVFYGGASLTIENCIVRHMTGDGIDFLPSAASNLSVSNTVMSDNGGDGVLFQLGGNTSTAVFNHVRASNNSIDGITVLGNGFTGGAAVYDSVAMGNVGNGYRVNNDTVGTVTLTVFQSVAAGNGTGLEADGGGFAILRVGNSMITLNANGWTAGGSTAVESYGDNYLNGNTSNETAPTGVVRK